MKSAVIQAYTFDELTSQLADLSFSPTVGMVFASVSLNIPRLAEFLVSLPYPVIGASSCGEFMQNPHALGQDHQEVITSEAMVMLLLDLPTQAFQTHLIARDGLDSDFALGQSIGQWAVSAFASPNLIVMASGLSLNGDELVRGMISHKADMRIFGGLAGDDSLFEQTWVFSNGQAYDSGAVAIAFSADQVEMVGNSVSGWQGIGAVKTVTHSEGNRLYTIDRQPALDTYIQYLSISEDELPQIGVDYPILLKQGDDAILRAVIMVDKQARALVFAGNIPQGAQIQFASCPGTEVLQSSKLSLEALHQQHDQADVLIAFSCMARHLALGPDIQDEIDHAARIWQAPIIGFFTYGEIGPNASHDTCMHNETLSLLLLKQK